MTPIPLSTLQFIQPGFIGAGAVPVPPTGSALLSDNGNRLLTDDGGVFLSELP